MPGGMSTVSATRHPRGLRHRLHRVGLFALVPLVGPARPQNHVCINVATYGPGGRFTMTDRGRGRAAPDRQDASRSARRKMRWDRRAAEIDIDEVSPPADLAHARPDLLTPSAVTEVELALTPDGRTISGAPSRPPPDRGRYRPPRLAMARRRIFRRQFRHPRAGGGFRLLDLGRFPVTARRDLLL
jgi:hypothetical protein